MQIYRSLEDVASNSNFGPCALTIGNFDGVHAGHQRIIERVVGIARLQGWKAAVLTFDPHPTRVVAPDRAPKLLSTMEQRCAVLASQGIDEVLVLPFDREVAKLTPEEFVIKILVEKLRARAVLVGDNFRFGHRQAGDVRTLTELGKSNTFFTEIVGAVSLRGRLISSSEVRRLVEAGEVSRAGRFLKRCFSLEGKVVPGQGIGSKQTVPTLNVETSAEVLPAVGVYITRTRDLTDVRSWPSVTNVGYRPTFEGRTLTIETFLLDALSGDTPPEIRVEFLKRLRGEHKFESADALKAQILRDVARAQTYFRRLSRWRRLS